MVYRDDLYAAVYVDSPKSMQELLAYLQKITGGGQEGFTISTENADILVTHNGYADEVKKQDSDDFIYYPYKLDIEAYPHQDLKGQIELVSLILNQLRQNGSKAVAAADFEDKLPRPK